MKGRISSTIWLVIAINAIAMMALVVLGFAAGGWAHSGNIRDGFSSSESGMRLIGAFVVLVVAAIATVSLLGSRIVKPTEKLVDYSEKIAAGDYRAQADISSQDDYGFIAENLNRSSEKLAKAM